MTEEKIETKRERMERLFSEVERELHPERFEEQPKEPSQKETDELNRIAREERIKAQGHDQLVGCVRQMLKDNVFKTSWERILASEFVELYECKRQNNTELNILRNFANAVDMHLEKAERSAREQDNHHYYKIFAEKVKQLIQNL